MWPGSSQALVRELLFRGTPEGIAVSIRPQIQGFFGGLKLGREPVPEDVHGPNFRVTAARNRLSSEGRVPCFCQN